MMAAFNAAPARLTRAFAVARLYAKRARALFLSACKRVLAPGASLFADDGRVEIRAGLVASVAFFGLFLGWAALAPLDAAVVAPGFVAVAGNRQTIQHRDGGVISKLAVREGQKVKQGDILVELEPSDVLAQERSLFSLSVDLQIQAARLRAEKAGLHDVAPPPEWSALSPDEHALAMAAFSERQSEETTHSRGGKRVWSEYGARIEGYQEELAAIDREEGIVREELQGMNALAAEQLVPLTRVRALERTIAETEGRRGELRALEAAARETRDDQARQVQGRLDELAPKLIAARAQLEQMRLRAPVSGTVMGLNFHTVGGVIRAGEHIMDIVPFGPELIVEAHVRPEDADNVAPGRATEVKITAFSGRDLPIAKGVVRQISADRFEDERTGRAYFTVQVVVPADEMRRIAAGHAERQLRAGLPAEIILPTRKRTALQYLFEPLNQTLWRSFRET